MDDDSMIAMIMNYVTNGSFGKHPITGKKSAEVLPVYEIDNGLMLSCYPENVLLTDAFLLKALSDIDNPIWWNVYEKINDNNVSPEETLKRLVRIHSCVVSFP